MRKVKWVVLFGFLGFIFYFGMVGIAAAETHDQKMMHGLITLALLMFASYGATVGEG